ncbi:MAG: 5-formyltetrahydrofolate cyclo-ligase [Kiritimatiellia bacterium]
MRTKEEIRAEMRRRRRELTEGQRRRASEAVCAALLERPDVQAARTARRPFAVYLATRDELDLAPLIEALWAADVTVAVPCWNAAERRYELGVYDRETTLVEGAHRIPEPAEVNRIAAADVGVWVVPGLAFTRAGGRIGYGGGWYDRFLRAAAPEAISLGVAHPFQIIDELPMDGHDQFLTAVVGA